MLCRLWHRLRIWENWIVLIRFSPEAMLAHPILFAMFLDSVSHSTALTEGLLQQLVVVSKFFLEGVAIAIIAVSAVQTVLRLLKNLELIRRQRDWSAIRLDLGVSLALALEFLLAADIVATAVSPSWDALGKLGAVTGIRIVLNTFLEKEVNQLEAKNRRSGHKAERHNNINRSS